MFGPRDAIKNAVNTPNNRLVLQLCVKKAVTDSRKEGETPTVSGSGDRMLDRLI
jgi:hypothetical protein